MNENTPQDIAKFLMEYLCTLFIVPTFPVLVFLEGGVLASLLLATGVYGGAAVLLMLKPGILKIVLIVYAVLLFVLVSLRIIDVKSVAQKASDISTVFSPHGPYADMRRLHRQAKSCRNPDFDTDSGSAKQTTYRTSSSYGSSSSSYRSGSSYGSSSSSYRSGSSSYGSSNSSYGSGSSYGSSSSSYRSGSSYGSSSSSYRSDSSSYGSSNSSYRSGSSYGSSSSSSYRTGSSSYGNNSRSTNNSSSGSANTRTRTIQNLFTGMNEEQARKTYLQLAKKYHPDNKGGDMEKFKKINEAYNKYKKEKGN